MGKILGQMSVDYTQIEDNSNILGDMFSNLSLNFQYSLCENQDFVF